MRWNRAWIQGATLGHLNWLLRGDELLDNVYIIRDGIAARPLEAELPWYVLLTVATHSRKHIFSGARLPPADLIVKGATDLSRKLMWGWKHRDDHSGQSPGLGMRFGTPAFKDVPEPEFRWCQAYLHNGVHRAYGEAAALAKKSLPHHTIPKFVSDRPLFNQETLLLTET